MAWEYTDKTKLLFMNAVNGEQSSHFGEIEDADGVGEHGSIACGDAMRFYFKVKKGATPLEDVIISAKYSTFGCTSAIASSEALCDIIEKGGYTPIEALKIKNEDIIKFLGGLPSQKIHCSVMGAETLEAAVADWAERRGVDLEAMGIHINRHEEDESRVVCSCYNVTEAELRRKIVELNLMTIEDITNVLKAGGACGACHHAPGGLQDLLDERWGQKTLENLAIERKNEEENTSKTPKLSPFQLAKRIEAVIDEVVRPILEVDGGGLEIVDIKENLVFISFTGRCASCPASGSTSQNVVERNLRDAIDDNLRVIEI